MWLFGYQTCVYQPVYLTSQRRECQDHLKGVDEEAAQLRAEAGSTRLSPLQREIAGQGKTEVGLVFSNLPVIVQPNFTSKSWETKVTKRRAHKHRRTLGSSLQSFRKTKEERMRGARFRATPPPLRERSAQARAQVAAERGLSCCGYCVAPPPPGPSGDPSLQARCSSPSTGTKDSVTLSSGLSAPEQLGTA